MPILTLQRSGCSQVGSRAVRAGKGRIIAARTPERVDEPASTMPATTGHPPL